MALTGIVLIPVSVDTWMKELRPGDAKHRAPIYENTRRFVRSAKNPYFWCGEAGTGFMHERFPRRAAANFARERFAPAEYVFRRIDTQIGERRETRFIEFYHIICGRSLRRFRTRRERASASGRLRPARLSEP